MMRILGESYISLPSYHYSQPMVLWRSIIIAKWNKSGRVLSFFSMSICKTMVLVSLLTLNGRAEEVQLYSRWDANLLSIELGDCNIKLAPTETLSPRVIVVWRQITQKYFLRANIYVDFSAAVDTEKRQFVFKKKMATGKDLFDAFLTAYPEYTYTQDPKTGIIWFHPKSIPYNEILNAKVRIKRSELQVAMYSGVLKPLFNLLYPNPKVAIDPAGVEPYEGSILQRFRQFDFPVDLPDGIYSARDILNFCCVASPNFAFQAYDENGLRRVSMLVPSQLYYNNPLALERPAAIRFWETEIGDTTNMPPSPNAIAAALSDSNPRKRWAAREYHKATLDLSHGIRSDDPKTAVWEMLGWKATGVENGNAPFLKRKQIFANQRPAVLTDLLFEDPGLALITSMELARETQDSSIMEVVSDHKFTETEIATIKPDVYRIARESKLVRDKLLAMKFDLPELSSEALNELANTNYFTLVPAETK